MPKRKRGDHVREALDLVCGITQDLLEDPVVTCDGHTYSRLAIERWLKNNDTSPLTNETLSSKVLYPNLFAQKQVAKYKEKLGLKLIELIEQKQTERVFALMDEGRANINVKRERDKKTPLLIACEMKLENVAKHLISNGAEWDATDADGKTMDDYLPRLRWDTVREMLGERFALICRCNSLFQIPFISSCKCDFEDFHHHILWARCLAEVLKKNMFEIMTVSFIYFNEQIKYLAKALEVNTELRTLTIFMDVQQLPKTCEGIKRLAEALKVNTCDEGINCLADILNSVNTCEGIKCLAEALKVNTSLKEIVLSGHVFEYKVGDEGAKYLADALKVNTSLEKISITWNISDVGVKCLAEALKVNTSLKDINLSDCWGPGDEGTKCLAEALKVNTSLEKIGIYQLSVVGERYLVDALKVNKSLKIVFKHARKNNKKCHSD